MQKSISALARQFPFAARLLSTTPAAKADIEVTEESSHVYHVKLNRPDRRNAFTVDMWRELVLFCRSGLISRIYDNNKELIEGALDLAKTIAEKSPIAVQGTKEVLNHARNHTIEESLDFVKTWNMSQLQAADLRNSAMAAMNKQKVEYENV
ncbi:hypothetical protein OESDEN_10101 [Oesophagostomum dentatum]|uniref:Enoyl-CoA hydratase/isomerase family protein n=1 Tax=Oesophagostomum dentatum TaxID=61180 RepID=A0A0B1T1M9_OESDE|nr:hypothetical protein OESDEN_10101 [Oesophagostomum dentatum]